MIGSKRKVWLAPFVAIAISISGYTSTTETPSTKTPSKEISQGRVSLVGAGASFPAPLYQRWFSEYNRVNPSVQVSYQSVGSGAGIEQFTKETVDFGASDVAMTDEEMAKVKKGVVLLPMTAGSVVLAYNLPGIQGLKLSRQAYVDILLGKITKWNAPAIASANPGVKLPDKAINVIYRSDGSGTTGVFTKHLSAISPEWKQKVGEGRTVQWPTGVGAKGNEGVTAQVKQTDGGIGYVEYNYAKELKLPVASLQNKAGKFMPPSEQSAANTLQAVTLPENMRAFIADPNGENSYPIVTYTWIMAYKQYESPEKLKAFKEVITWALNDGQKLSTQLGYVPLPKNVADKVKASLNKIQAK